MQDPTKTQWIFENSQMIEVAFQNSEKAGSVS